MEALTLHITGPLCVWESTGDQLIPSQRASNAENDSIPWRHHSNNVPLIIYIDIL